MRNHNHRVLTEYHLTPAQWAILQAASAYLPAPAEQFVLEAQMEAEEDFSEKELVDALDECLMQGWIGWESDPEPESSPRSGEPESGVVLTEEGMQLKDQTGQALMETAEID